MAIVGVDSNSLYSRTRSLSRLAWDIATSLGWRPLGAVLHSSNEPGELSQWLCHDDSTINIVLELLLLLLLLMTLTLTEAAMRSYPMMYDGFVFVDSVERTDSLIDFGAI